MYGGRNLENWFSMSCFLPRHAFPVQTYAEHIMSMLRMWLSKQNLLRSIYHIVIFSFRGWMPEGSFSHFAFYGNERSNFAPLKKINNRGIRGSRLPIEKRKNMGALHPRANSMPVQFFITSRNREQRTRRLLKITTRKCNPLSIWSK